MESPSLPMDVRDINVCLLSAKKKSASSPSLTQLDNMSLCNFPTSMSVTEELHSLSETRGNSISRKRSHPDFDTQSVDITFREPSAKKARRPLSKVIANKLRDSPLKQARNSIKRSLSFSRGERPAPSPASKYRLSATPRQTLSSVARKKRLNLSKSHLPENWSEAVGGAAGGGASRLEKYSKEEVNRQEAIWAIYRTENEMTDDLRMIINIFYHPMLRLGLVSEEEHCQLFGNLQTILSLHEGLVSQLEELKSGDDLYFQAVGKALLDWSVKLAPYAEYCANLVGAKPVLEQLKQEPAVEDFLQRCLDSEFSRKIDLWTFLDSPRSRIMKYPLLLKEVRKRTAEEHTDHQHLSQALASFETLIKDIDHCTGVAKCRHVISRLEYIHDDQRSTAIDNSQFILCSGVLRNKNGSKLHAFLFDKAFVLTRPSSRTSRLGYQVYRQPLPLTALQVTDLCDGDARLGGSFKGAIKNTGTTGCKFMFRVTCSDPCVSRHAHTLQANGDYDKKAWLDAFKTVVPVICSASPTTTV